MAFHSHHIPSGLSASPPAPHHQPMPLPHHVAGVPFQPHGSNYPGGNASSQLNVSPNYMSVAPRHSSHYSHAPHFSYPNHNSSHRGGGGGGGMNVNNHMVIVGGGAPGHHSYRMNQNNSTPSPSVNDPSPTGLNMGRGGRRGGRGGGGLTSSSSSSSLVNSSSTGTPKSSTFSNNSSTTVASTNLYPMRTAPASSVNLSTPTTLSSPTATAVSASLPSCSPDQGQYSFSSLDTDVEGMGKGSGAAGSSPMMMMSGGGGGIGMGSEMVSATITAEVATTPSPTLTTNVKTTTAQIDGSQHVLSCNSSGGRVQQQEVQTEEGKEADVSSSSSSLGEEGCTSPMSAVKPMDVAHSFVYQYYYMLHGAPGELHRFYDVDSEVFRVSDRHPPVEYLRAKGQKDIHAAFKNCHFDRCTSRIRVIEAQQSLGGGLMVLVTGKLKNGAEMDREFVQTVFLARQAAPRKGWYVYNEIFCYLDAMGQEEETSRGGEPSSSGEGDIPPSSTSVASLVNDVSPSTSVVVGREEEERVGVTSEGSGEEQGGFNGVCAKAEGEYKEENGWSEEERKEMEEDDEMGGEGSQIGVEECKREAEQEREIEGRDEAEEQEEVDCSMVNETTDTHMEEVITSDLEVAEGDETTRNEELSEEKSVQDRCGSLKQQWKQTDDVEGNTENEAPNPNWPKPGETPPLPPISYQSPTTTATTGNVLGGASDSVRYAPMPLNYEANSYAGKLFKNLQVSGPPVRVGFAIPCSHQGDSDHSADHSVTASTGAQTNSGTSSDREGAGHSSRPQSNYAYQSGGMISGIHENAGSGNAAYRSEGGEGGVGGGASITSGRTNNMVSSSSPLQYQPASGVVYNKKIWVSEIPHDMDDEMVKRAVADQLKRLDGHVVQIDRIPGKQHGYLELDCFLSVESLFERGLFFRGRMVRIAFARPSPPKGGAGSSGGRDYDREGQQRGWTGGRGGGGGEYRSMRGGSREYEGGRRGGPGGGGGRESGGGNGKDLMDDIMQDGDARGESTGVGGGYYRRTAPHYQQQRSTSYSNGGSAGASRRAHPQYEEGGGTHGHDSGDGAAAIASHSQESGQQKSDDEGWIDPSRKKSRGRGTGGIENSRAGRGGPSGRGGVRANYVGRKNEGY